jgi:hypothetical protein
MKKTFFYLIMTFSLSSLASAQADSLDMKSGKVSNRVNDWEWVLSVIGNNEDFEGVVDSVRVKLKSITYPAGTAQITIDSITNREALLLDAFLRIRINQANQQAYSRIVISLRAMNSTFINNRLTARDDAEDFEFTNQRAIGKKRIRRN